MLIGIEGSEHFEHGVGTGLCLGNHLGGEMCKQQRPQFPSAEFLGHPGKGVVGRGAELSTFESRDEGLQPIGGLVEAFVPGGVDLDGRRPAAVERLHVRGREPEAVVGHRSGQAFEAEARLPFGEHTPGHLQAARHQVRRLAKTVAVLADHHQVTAGHELVEVRVHASRLRDDVPRQGVDVGRLELGQLAVFQDQLDYRVDAA